MADEPTLPQMIGRYEIRGEIGRGGMATVYRAFDPLAKREVALKVLPHELLHNPQFRVRFAREAEVIASLEHAAIVPVYDFGEDPATGQPFFVMRRMTGGSLEERLVNGPLAIAECARIFNRLAPALDRAHARGIIHRDLKPGNILFDEDNNPYISDFGIVKITESNSSITGSGVVGTPAYMSPEQATGEENIDGRSDVYALGAILFQMLSGKYPYKADTPMGVVVKHITAPDPLILEAKADLPEECDDLIQRAMAKKRDERYQTANDLAAALSQIAGVMPTLSMADNTVPLMKAPPGSLPTYGAGSALPTVAANLTTRSAPRRWLGLLVMLIVILALAAGGVTLYVTNAAAQQTATAAAVALSTATGQALQTGTAIARSNAAATVDAEQTSAFLLANPTNTATPAPTETAAPTNTPTTEPTATATPTAEPTQFGGGTGLIVFTTKRDGNNEIYAMSPDGSNLTRLTTHTANDSFPVWSPDGSQIAFYTNRDGNNDIYIMNADGSALTRLTDHPASDFSPAWSPDGTKIVFISNRDGNNRVYVMNANGANVVMLTDDPSGHEAPQWSPDGTRIAFFTNQDGNYEIHVMSADGSNRIRLTTNAAEDSFPAWSPDSNFILFSTNRDGNLELYTISASDGSNLTRITNNTSDDNFPAWSPDGTHIAFTAYRDGNPEIYLINADGSGPVRLTDNPAIDFGPAWQP